MAYCAANVELTDTFDIWRIRSNQAFTNLCSINPTANTLTANTVTGNTVYASSMFISQGLFDSLGVATFNDTSIFSGDVQLDGANTDVSGHLYISSNTRVTSTVEANFFRGDGSQLTNLPGGNITANTQLGEHVITTHAYAPGSITEDKLAASIDLGLESGTRLLFHQAAAPTGWTQDITGVYDDAGLKVVTGAGGGYNSGTAYSTVFASRTPTGSVSSTLTSLTLNNTVPTGTVSTTLSGSTSTKNLGTKNTSYVALSTSQMPAHTHFIARDVIVSNDNLTATGSNRFLAVETTAGGDTEYDLGGTGSTPNVGVTSTTGGGASHRHSVTIGSHNHSLSSGTATSIFTGDAHTHTLNTSTIVSSFVGASMDFAVKNIEVILATKD